MEKGAGFITARLLVVEVGGPFNTICLESDGREERVFFFFLLLVLGRFLTWSSQSTEGMPDLPEDLGAVTDMTV